MNPYLILGSGLGTNEENALSARLSAWHDAMVAHERRLRTGKTSDVCDDECPHAEARGLWSEAIAAFGPRAHELTFLRSRANESTRRLKANAAAREPMAEAADTARASRSTRDTQEHRALVAASKATRAVEL
jgi:dihydroorotase-like cyclic amidohydrolase